MRPAADIAARVLPLLLKRLESLLWARWPTLPRGKLLPMEGPFATPLANPPAAPAKDPLVLAPIAPNKLFPPRPVGPRTEVKSCSSSGICHTQKISRSKNGQVCMEVSISAHFSLDTSFLAEFFSCRGASNNTHGTLKGATRIHERESRE